MSDRAGGPTVPPTVSACFDFIDRDGRRSRVTAIIIPIKFMRYEDSSSTGVVYGCSRGPFCFNPTCRYSTLGRGQSERDVMLHGTRKTG